jgi:hypothetical protein
MSEKLPSGQTPIEVFCRAAELGLSLGVRPGNKLTVQPIEACPPNFVETLRESKPWLLIMLRWPFAMVHSKALEETIFFCADDNTREWLIDAGADPFSIYTRDELRVLCEQNRVAPLSPDELRKVHEIKRTFNGRIAK